MYRKLLTFQVYIYCNLEDILHQCEKCYFKIIAFNILYAFFYIY